MAAISRTPFKRLKVELGISGIDRKYLAKVLGRSESYVQFRLGGDSPWSINDVYTICDVLQIPYELIPEYFPKNGILPKPTEQEDPYLAAFKRRMAAEKKAKEKVGK